MAVAGHVPAWKKLGLKLKNATDVTEVAIPQSISSSTDGVNESGVSKRKIPVSKEADGGVKHQSPPAKKIKTSQKHDQTKQGSDEHSHRFEKVSSLGSQDQSRTWKATPPEADHAATARRGLRIHTPDTTSELGTLPSFPSTLPSIELCDPEASENSPSGLASTPTLLKRKSVSFTPETKMRDGDSTKQLYSSWLKQQGNDFDPNKSSQALRPVSPSSIPLTNRDGNINSGQTVKSKPTKQKHTLLSGIIDQKPIGATLEYLNTYYSARDTWKFNKSKQNQILKHALNTSKIPPSHDAALKSYVQGLNSAGARKRLRGEALSQIKEDAEVTGVTSEDTDEDDEEFESGSSSEMSSSTNSSKEEKKVKREESPTHSKADIAQDESDGASNSSFSESSSEDDDEVPDAQSKAKAEHKAAKAAAKAARRQDEPTLRKYYRSALRKYKRELKQNILDREERQKIQDPAWRMRLLKRKRAELIMWTIDIDEFAENGLHRRMPEGGMAEVLKPGEVVYEEREKSSVKTGVVADKGRAGAKNGVVGKQKRRRIRKRRTGLPDDDSSSEESSSDSDSVISEDERGKKKGEEMERALGRILTRELEKMGN